MKALGAQEIRYDHRTSADFQSSVVTEAVRRLDVTPERVVSRRWRTSRNADMYLVEAPGRKWLLKILVSKPEATLAAEFGHLEELHALAATTGTFRVPKPLFSLPGRSAYLMELVEGDRADRAVVRDPSGPGSCSLMRACGRALAEIHGRWAEPMTDAEVRAHLDRITDRPWRADRAERVLIDRLVRDLEQGPQRGSRLYLDFDPVNVLRAPDGVPILLDPPEVRQVGIAEWDLGTFLFGVRRAAWRSPLNARAYGREREALARAFLSGYEDVMGPAPNPDAAATLRTLCQLGRVAQLWSWWLRPFRFRYRVSGVARAAYAYPLLARARRRLLRELEAGRP